MLDLKTVHRLQEVCGVKSGVYKESEVGFSEYTSNCRLFISKNLPNDYETYDDAKKYATLLNVTTQFVDKHLVKVRGYISEEGVLDRDLLLTDVFNKITGEDILKEALEDPNTDEIQINDMKTIKVVVGGKAIPYRDSKGRLLQFDSNTDINILISRLIDDGTGKAPQFTDGNPILNEKTFKHQYRVNAVHPTLNTMCKPPFNFPITTVTIRKFKEVKLTLNDLILGDACTEDMGKLAELFGRIDIRLFCVGSTGSGKTTLLDVITHRIPRENRIVAIQNPSEVTFFDRDEFGANQWNVVHWEVREGVKGGTMGEQISNALRATPDVLFIGELREPVEFAQALRGARTGHTMFSTYHAEDARDAISRWATEISSVGSSSYFENLRLVADGVNIIIEQKKYKETGERKIKGICEILGVDANGEVMTNYLYKYVTDGEIVEVDGKKKLVGEFKKTGNMSVRLQEKFFEAGITYDIIAPFCKGKRVE